MNRLMVMKFPLIVLAAIITFLGTAAAQVAVPPPPPTVSWSFCTTLGCATCVANTTSTPKSAGCTLSNGCGFSWIEGSGWTAGCP